MLNAKGFYPLVVSRAQEEEEEEEEDSA